jgi:hypothetical protein
MRRVLPCFILRDRSGSLANSVNRTYVESASANARDRISVSRKLAVFAKRFAAGTCEKAANVGHKKSCRFISRGNRQNLT